jgi:prepilin-type N-terminal cleavage/methylation domain-containing protein
MEMKKFFSQKDFNIQNFSKKNPRGFTHQNFARQNLGGFTLVELLVVIAIIGLLSSIVLVSLGGARQKARDAKGQSELRQIITAFELKYNENTVYPDLPDTATAIASGDTRLSPHLSPTPYTNGVRTYFWYDGGSNQKFCVYFQSEKDPTTYFTCSHKGCQTNNTTACPNF